MGTQLGDLNNHLFAQLERMARDDMTPEEIEREVKRADAIVGISEQIVRTADTRLKAAKLYADHGDKLLPHLPLIGKSEP
ncbi:hypothetical protein [Seohaeicola zhoushanensis]|uniref:Uncharacterized protein n=1 Tax=Seohaeicola zhoushanensis TaxID=1569283 RepID=A0A8J3M9W0_9RHOB|nr:hypothetical protein [Seohaeicola zhoushanensis]GHF70947.1 hypothetical protein GCM10017056_47320 [Seohaeicola zhoushanensis]